MLLGTLGASLLGNLLTGKGIVRAGSGNNKGKGIVRVGSVNNKETGVVRAGYGRPLSSASQKTIGFLMKPHPLTNLEIQKYYENKSKFNGVFSRDNLPKKVKDGAYVINLDEHKDTGTHWIALLCNRNEIVLFDSFGVEHIPEEIKEFIGNRKIKANIFRVQANNSVMCGYFCIGFIDFMLAGKKLTDYTNLFSPYDFDKNDQIILSYFKDA